MTVLDQWFGEVWGKYIAQIDMPLQSRLTDI